MLSKARLWISHNRTLTVLALLVGLVELVNLWPREQAPRIVRTFASSTLPLRVQWMSQDFSHIMTSSPSGAGFAMSSATGKLVGFDMQTGLINWQDDLGFVHTNPRALLANDRAVFVVTTSSVDAYSATTGKQMWSTGLGAGHVSIIAQLDSNILRVYYGDKVYELDPDSGRKLLSEPNGGIYWVSGNVVIRYLSAKQVAASDKLSGQPLWASDHVFYVEEGQEPHSAGPDTLIVARAHSFNSVFANGLCALSLATGAYAWCLDGTFVSKPAVDSGSQVGYVMRSDSILLSIDLRSGGILGETRFLPSELPKELEFLDGAWIASGKGAIAVTFYDGGDSRQTFGLSFSQ
jgi:outer membrane protein assembly factor BamB